MDRLLGIEDLHVHFDLRRHMAKALNGVDLDLFEGEILGLVGETGSGKSMTALSILRLIPSPGRVVSGKIIFQGEDLLIKSERDMKQIRGSLISMIFQNPRESLNPVFKMGEQLEAIYHVHHPKASKQELSRRTLEMMQAVGMPDPLARMEAYPHELSGGMCQRFMIGMALVCDPNLLIADEPTTALDVTVQAGVLELILELVQSKGASCLYITHDLGVVAETCDSVAVMYAGRIVETGTVEEIFDRPLHPYTQGLIASTLRVDRYQPIAVIAGEVPDAASLPPGCPFWPRCDYARDLCREIYPEVVRLASRRSVSCHKIGQDW
jgi:oligopeptide/dipeptide ABC transporter ATP-binding protein